jgi:hypothetical protein
MNLSTKIEGLKTNNSIDYYSKLILVGSCFSDSTADKLSSHLFEVSSNPFGISYNPLSITKNISRIIDQNTFREDEFIQDKELWFHYDLHSSWSSTNLSNLTSELNAQIDKSHRELKQATHLFVTLGTAFVYELKSTKSIVSNCHKQKASLFEKRLLSISEIKQSIRELYLKLQEFNPDLKVIFTISPVRHQKDGLIENNRSKAHLRAALFDFLEEQSHCEYFPSYEILLDELRDYRYYDRDLLHPNALAIDIIWERFVALYMENNCIEDMKTAVSIVKAENHKSFHPERQEHRLFLNKNIQRKTEFYNKYPHLNVR